MRFAELLSGSDRQLNTLEWVEARRRFPTVRAAFDDFLPDWWPQWTRLPAER